MLLPLPTAFIQHTFPSACLMLYCIELGNLDRRIIIFINIA